MKLTLSYTWADSSKWEWESAAFVFHVISGGDDESTAPGVQRERPAGIMKREPGREGQRATYYHPSKPVFPTPGII